MFKNWFRENKLLIIIAGMLVIFMVLGWVLYNLFAHQLIKAMYEGRSIGILNRVIISQDVHPVEHYFEIADQIFIVCNIGVVTFLCFTSLVFFKLSTLTITMFCSVVGTMLILANTNKYGVGISADSTFYIGIARNLLFGSGYLAWTGCPTPEFPPLFSTILATIGLVGIDPLIGARFFNALVFGLIIFFSGKLFSIFVRSKVLIILGTLSVLLSGPLLLVLVMAWTEPLFILLVILFIVYTYKFLSRKQWSVLFLLSAITAFSCVQRYMGVTLVLAGCIFIFSFLKNTSFWQRLKYAIVFCIVSLTPFLAWITRNHVLSGTFFGPRFPSDVTLLQNIYAALSVVLTWFVPRNISFFIRMRYMGFILLIIMITAFFLRLKRNRRNDYGSISILPVGIFILIYSGFLVGSATKVAFDGISNRLLSPIFVPVTLFVLVAMDSVMSVSGQPLRHKSKLNLVVTIAVIFWLLYTLSLASIITARAIHRGAGGYNTVTWKESPFMEWVKTHSLDGVIYSNAPDAIYILTGTKAILSPRKTQFRSSVSEGDNLQQFKESLRSNIKTYLVWFDPIRRGHLFDIKDLRSVFVMKEVVAFSNGTVYLFDVVDVAKE